MGKRMTAKKVEKRIEKTSHLNPKIRLDAIKYLWEIKDERAIPILLECLNDRLQDYRAAALEALTMCHRMAEITGVNWYEIETKVMEITKDRAGNVRNLAWDCLREIGGIRSAKLYFSEYENGYLTPVNLTEDDVFELTGQFCEEDLLRFKIITKIIIDENTNITDEGKISLLVRWFENDHPEIKLTAALLLGIRGDYRAEEYVFSEFKLDTFGEYYLLYKDFFKHSDRKNDALKIVINFLPQVTDGSLYSIINFLMSLGANSDIVQKCLPELLLTPSYRDDVLSALRYLVNEPPIIWNLDLFKDGLEKIVDDSSTRFYERKNALEVLSHILNASEWLNLFLSLEDYEYFLKFTNSFDSTWRFIKNLSPASTVNKFLLDFVNSKDNECRTLAISSLTIEEQPEILELLTSIIKDRKEDPKTRRAALENLRQHLLQQKIHDEKMDRFFLSLIKQKPLASTCIKYLFDVKHQDAGELLKVTFNKHPKWFGDEEDILQVLELLVEIGNKETLVSIKKIRHLVSIPEFMDHFKYLAGEIKHRVMNP